MENATKALTMAGAVFLALMIIGAFTLMYRQLSELEQTRTDAEESTKNSNYTREFEPYNKSIYGSELMSLANLQEDYNNSEERIDGGYPEIKITVTISRPIPESTYFLAGTKDLKQITDDKNKIENVISTYETNAKYKGKTVQYYSQINNRQIASIYGIDFSSDELDYDIGERLAKDGKTRNLMAEIETYKNIKSIYTEFKNKKFKCTEVTYNKDGNINSMSFVEQS